MFGGSAGVLPSTMNHDFSRVPKAEIQRSVFNRDHGLKTTFDAGYLIPILFDEAPADRDWETFFLVIKSFTPDPVFNPKRLAISLAL